MIELLLRKIWEKKVSKALKARILNFLYKIGVMPEERPLLYAGLLHDYITQEVYFEVEGNSYCRVPIYRKHLVKRGNRLVINLTFLAYGEWESLNYFCIFSEPENGAILVPPMRLLSQRNMTAGDSLHIEYFMEFEFIFLNTSRLQ